MAIIGIGIDTVDIARIRATLDDAHVQFLQNVFTAGERAYCDAYADPAPHYAGTFAAKEATRKATGDLGRDFASVEVIRTPLGKPEVWLSGIRSETLHLSITHTDTIANAIVIYEQL